MAQYIAAYKGYIADVPRVWFKRCDGHIFYFDEITQASATPQTNFTEINAGWQLFPVAVLPGQQTFEISLTSGQFNSEMFAMASNSSFATEARANDKPGYLAYFTETVTFSNQGVAKLSYVPVANSVWFNGVDDFTVSISGTDGKQVTVVATEGVDQYLTGEVEVTYQYELDTAEVMYSNNREAAIGEVFMRWPVYSSGEDCSDSTIKGYVELHLFKCRVTQGPGFDTSYKSAATNQCTFAAIDAKRSDDKAYSIAYFQLPIIESQQAG